jgi:hypothetical protein
MAGENSPVRVVSEDLLDLGLALADGSRLVGLRPRPRHELHHVAADDHLRRDELLLELLVALLAPDSRGPHAAHEPTVP